MATAQIIITIEEEELKAAEIEIVSLQDWSQHMVIDKCRKCTDRIIEKETNFNPKKMTKTEKLDFIKNADLISRIERDELEGP